jgi:hypothetical protein
MLSRTLTVVSIAFFSGAAGAQGEEPGKFLYSGYCGDCHYERVHEKTRESSSVKDLADLRAVVERRAAYTKHRFTAQEIDAVTRYLNSEYYKLAR